MATYEQDIAMYETKENGDKVIKLPITRANNVEGIGRSTNTAYVVGDVVYVDNNKKVALICTTDGTTSSGELDVSNKAIGNTVSDGSVKWQVVNRAFDIVPVTSGGTGATTAQNARDNLKTRLITYTNITQLGLTIGSETIETIVDAMEENSTLTYGIGVGYNTAIYPDIYGIVTITKTNPNRTRIVYTSNTGTNYWGFYDKNDGKFDGWRKLATTNSLMPQLSGATSASANFVAPQDGWLHAHFENFNDRRALFIDGVNVGYAYSTNNTGYQYPCWIPIKKGSKITQTGSAIAITYYPCIGA